MIQSEQQVREAIRQLGVYELALEQLRAELEPQNPAFFSDAAKGYLHRMRRIHEDIEEYYRRVPLPLLQAS